jgi:hypothetical protein
MSSPYQTPCPNFFSQTWCPATFPFPLWRGKGTERSSRLFPSEGPACRVSTSAESALRFRWSRCWSCSASSPRNDRGCNGTEAVRCMSPGRDIAARSRSMWRSVATIATGAAVTATSSSSGRLRRSCRCTEPRWIYAIGSAATFPGFGVGDALLGHRAATPWPDVLTSQNGTERRPPVLDESVRPTTSHRLSRSVVHQLS